MALSTEQLEAQKMRMREYRKRKRAEMGNPAYKKQQNAVKEKYREGVRAKKTPNIFASPTIPAKYSDMLKDLSDSVKDALKKISEGTLSTFDANAVLPALNRRIQAAPEDLVKIGSQKNCDDLIEDIVANNDKRIEEDPRLEKSLPEPATVEGHVKKLNFIWRAMTGRTAKGDTKTQNCLDYEWTRDTDKVVKFLTKRYDNIKTFNSYVSSFSSHLRNLVGFEKEHVFYSKLSSKTFQEKILPAQKENKLSDAQKKNYVTYPILLRNRKKLKPGTQESAVVSMYMDAPPRRIKDYSLMKIYQQPPNKKAGKKNSKFKKPTELSKQFNYLVLDSKGGVKEMVYNNYKTRKDFGQQVIVPDKTEMNKSIKPYIKAFGLKSGGFLFPQVKADKSMGSGFGALVSKSFGKIAPAKKSPGAGLLRHSYVSYIRKEFGNSKPDSFFEAIATKMAHSYSTSLTYRVLEDA